MSAIPKPEWMPRAYGGCKCQCHRDEAVTHLGLPCCYPDRELVNDLGRRMLFPKGDAVSARFVPIRRNGRRPNA